MLLHMNTQDREILHGFYDKYARRVYDRCFYFLRNEEEAKDAMHDVFIKAQKNLPGFRADASPLTWLTRIASNHCLNLIRAQKAQWHEKYRQEVKTEQKEIEGGVTRNETHQLLRICFHDCEPQVAEAAVLYFVDEMTQKEIVAIIGISAPTLRKRLREFVETSRQRIEKEVPGIVFQPSII